MGKRKVTKNNQSGLDSALKARSLSKFLKKKTVEGTLYVESTYNNTKLTLADKLGNVLA
jgi:ribosomal protein S11